MIGPGYGMELNGGRVLTALHVAYKIDFPIIYADTEKDIAVIETGHKNKCNIRFKSTTNAFVLTESVPQPGESGKPYIIDGKIYGVIIGENGNYGIVATLDESIIQLLNRK